MVWIIEFFKVLRGIKFVIVLRLFVGWKKLHGKGASNFLQLGFVVGVM